MAVEPRVRVLSALEAMVSGAPAGALPHGARLRRWIQTAAPFK
jgi:hypothetical protein